MRPKDNEAPKPLVGSLRRLGKQAMRTSPSTATPPPAPARPVAGSLLAASPAQMVVLSAARKRLVAVPYRHPEAATTAPCLSGRPTVTALRPVAPNNRTVCAVPQRTMPYCIFIRYRACPGRIIAPRSHVFVPDLAQVAQSKQYKPAPEFATHLGALRNTVPW
jgi:hypothetical protein